MAQNNIRQLREKKHLPKSPDSLISALAATEVNDSPRSASAGLIDAGIILEVIPYPVALWSSDRRSCIFNHPTRELLGFSEDDFLENSALWLERIHPQDRPAFLSAWTKVQAGEKKVSCKYRFLPKSQATALRLREISIFHSRRQSDTPGIWSLYTEEPPLEDGFAGPYPLQKLLHGLT